MARKSRSIVTCIVCGRKLNNFATYGCQPNGGVAFSSPGHYGTSVFDPMDGSFLEVVVCDDCLTKAGKAGIVLISKATPVRHNVNYHVWSPDLSPPIGLTQPEDSKNG